MEVTLENGSKSLFTKWFKNEKVLPDKDIKDHVQLETESGEAGFGW
jgi:hypothetical protein